jgi:16S rRNA (cytosine1402-N4)-methyltransferase
VSEINQIPHEPVLLKQVLESFQTENEGYFIDATLGYGGHSSAILENYPNIHLIGIDRDITAINFSKKRLEKFGNRFRAVHGKFSEKIDELISELNDKPIFGVLADIGVSSLQLDVEDRGFSFHSDNLDMRMDQSADLTAETIVNRYSQYELEKIFSDFGEMRNSKKVAKAIVDNRPFSSGKELASLMEKLEKRKGGGSHPATQLFQAIRIEVNGELDELSSLLKSLERLPETRVGIISFHSLEDRIVKEQFRDWAKSCICPPEAFKCTCGDNHQLGKIVTKKPLVADKDEIKSNRRSRSAKLRVFQIEKD